MNKAHIPSVVFALFLIGYVIFLVCSVSLLPQHMATHLDARGRPNGWMNRSSTVLFQGVIGLVLPLIIEGGFWTIRFVPTQVINVPRRDFWFAPERRFTTCAYLSRQGLWLASLLILLQGFLWFEVVQSNSESIPHLSSSEFWVTLGVFGLAMIVWRVRFFRHFASVALEP